MQTAKVRAIRSLSSLKGRPWSCRCSWRPSPGRRSRGRSTSTSTAESLWSTPAKADAPVSCPKSAATDGRTARVSARLSGPASGSQAARAGRTSAVAVVLLGVTGLAGARSAVHGLVSTAFDLRRCRRVRSDLGGLSRLGAWRPSSRGGRAVAARGRLAAGGPAGPVSGVPGFTHRPLGINLAHRRITAVSLRRGTDTAPQGAGRPVTAPGIDLSQVQSAVNTLLRVSSSTC